MCRVLKAVCWTFLGLTVLAIAGEGFGQLWLVVCSVGFVYLLVSAVIE